MKNVFKFGFLAFTLSLSLTSCDWFTNSSDSAAIDSNKIDSPQVDSPKTDSPTIDSNKIKVDSEKIKH
ncbi:hypothetical protein EZ428_08745 [Pedobacter frigiditerrae]|uniref:Lipoprotein n=1 Tax=Pedobacter frigiditerrae TaxID=2530452 RepID=A0A4V2MIV4_9SPHI|nr:hypothetical protein [Pedobacter frigiditerrae]TCC91826.1 hypothetical protein EZ428_08745 [Pedobacter frigiditerrae]